MKQIIEIAGIVEKILFSNKENGYTVLVLNKGKGKSDTVVCNQAGVELFNYVTFHGEYKENKKFGSQFVATSYEISHPKNNDLLESYLINFQGIGFVLAKRLIDYFGDNTLNILNTDIDQLKEVKGFTEKIIEQLKIDWNKDKNSHKVIMELQKLGISKNQSFEIYDLYGPTILEQIAEDPYLLYTEGSLGFVKCDELALKQGIQSDSVERLTHGILYVINSILDEGNTWTTKDELIQSTERQLSVFSIDEEIAQIIDLLVSKKLIHYEDGRYSPYVAYLTEKAIAKNLLDLNAGDFLLSDSQERNVEKAIESANITLSDQQLTAIKNIPSHGFSVLTGGAGVGKTTTVKVLLSALLSLRKTIVMAAPTGRAAQRLSEVTSYKVQTIHRLLGFNFEEGGFTHNENNPLDGDFFIVDEFSMTDIYLFSSFLKALPRHAQLLVIGDKQQLPSVGPGNILHDIIESKKFPVHHLTQIFRQDETSKIVEYSYNIVDGKEPMIPSPLENMMYFEKQFDCLFIDSDFLEEVDKKIYQKYKDKIIKNPYKYRYAGESGAERKNCIDVRPLYDAERKNLIGDDLNKKITCYNRYNAINYDLNPLELIEQLYTTIIPKYYGDKEIQILSPQKQTDIGTVALNKKIQDSVNPKGDFKKEIALESITFREGDKVIQLKNNYEKGIFNGEIGYITKVFEVDKKILVDFSYGDNDKKVLIERELFGDLDLAYAITIHKSQGSEFDCVILPISYLHKGMLFKNLIYTGMTRGKKLVIFVGQRKALEYGITNTYKITRNTNLKFLLE